MQLNRYQKTAIITVLATLFLIFVGGLVRAAGAGLGCPDWPQCFGSWVPPLSAADLPPEYDPDLFNPFQTWLEYINRLVGVSIGLLIILTFVFSFRYRKSKPYIVYCSALSLVLVVFQGWLGGQVVESELAEWLITAHMLLAMVIVTLLLFTTFKAVATEITLKISEGARASLLYLGIALLALTLVQMVLGTQVREAVDAIMKATPDLPREHWVPSLGTLFEVHRSASWLLLILAALVPVAVWRARLAAAFKKVAAGIVGVVVLQTLAGIGLAYLDIPPALQVTHLTLSAVTICLQFLLVLMVVESTVAEEPTPVLAA